MRPAAAIAVLLFMSSVASAQAVTFDEAIGLVRGTPRVRGAERALETRRREDANLRGASHGLSIQATPGARVRSEADRGFEGQLGITHSWNLGRLGRARRSAASAERRALGAAVRAAALDARLEAARLWIDLWRVLALEAFVAEEAELADRLVDTTERALRAGAGTRADESEARAHAADVSLRALTLEGDRHEGSLALAVAMGRPPVSSLVAAGALPDPSLPEDPAPSVARVERLPAPERARLEAAAERARAIEVRASAGAALGLGAQAMRESPDGIIVQGVATLSLPIGDPSQRERSRALGEAERLRGEAEASRSEAARALVLAFHEVEHARREEGLLADRFVPAVEALVAQREAALSAGEATVFELLDARRRLVAARTRAIEATALRAWFEVRLWSLLAELERGATDGALR